jgi:chemotaxis protein MotA
MLALDAQIGDPKSSQLFQKFPRVLRNHHVTEYICNSLALILEGKPDSAALAESLDAEITVMEREHHAAVAAMSKTADALPGFGIVAAVLGIVVTMEAIGGPVEEIGHKVGAALVGTFLGILLSYGVAAPMAGRMEHLGEDETVFFRSISSAVIAIAQSANPKEVVIRASRSVGTACRPNRAELRKILNDA